MSRLFVQYLAIYNNENNAQQQQMTKMWSKFFQILNKRKKTAKDF